jgi:hypothetical protein
MVWPGWSGLLREGGDMSAIDGRLLGELRLLFHHLTVMDRSSLSQLLEASAQLRGNPVVRRYAEHFTSRAGALPNCEGDELEKCLSGWGAYYTARYEDAGRSFRSAWNERRTWASWSALGMGKVCSDLGHWYDSGMWILCALSTARIENDLYRMSECYGALGEVLLRGGCPKQAYEQFAADTGLLPPGSGHALRLTNYRGICLGRLGHPELAEPLLWQAFYAGLERDPGSAGFSCASLLALSVHHRDEALADRVERERQRCGLELRDMPGGFGQICAAYWALNGRTRKREEARRALVRARSVFEKHYPIESHWSTALQQTVIGDTVNTDRLAELQERSVPAVTEDALASISQMDASLVEVLSRWKGEQAFARIAEAYSAEDYWGMLDLFFI